MHSLALALVALGLIIVGSNLRWWVILDVEVNNDLFSSLGLSKDWVCVMTFPFFISLVPIIPRTGVRSVRLAFPYNKRGSR